MKSLRTPFSRSVSLLVLTSAMAFGASAQAQEFKVGFVNTDRIFREANAAKAALTSTSPKPA